MASPAKRILIFELEDGRAPFIEWMDSLERDPIYNIVMTRLDRVELGNLGEHKRDGEGVVELIFRFGPGYRIYLGNDGAELVILLAGGTKRTQQRDIEQAKVLWRLYRG